MTPAQGSDADVSSTGVDPDFWRGRRVLITGHTGFKGSWLSLWLSGMGAHVTGVANGVPTTPSLFEDARVAEDVEDLTVDVRDADALAQAVVSARPEVVIHMAAQSLVRPSFADPVATYEVNLMGTVNLIDAVRGHAGVRAVVNVTSDKCYANRETDRAYRESDPMGGADPYSSSKGCAELVTEAYRHSFFTGSETRLASARAGNVIGGGDWAVDRLVPDIMRSALADATIPVRNPNSIRPWQHVLNPLGGYLVLAQALWHDEQYAGGWNFGPADDDARPVSWIVRRISELWPDPLQWELSPGPHPHEARYLKLDSAQARTRLGWQPSVDLDSALRSVVDWYRERRNGADMRTVTREQIAQLTRPASRV